MPPTAVRRLIPAALALALMPPLAASAAEVQDPMDRLRERLAEKLGATKATPANPNVLRVATRPQADAASAPAASAAKAATRSASAKPRAKPSALTTCENGQRQSPIDLRDGIRVQLEPVQFGYQASGFRVIDTGHTVQVNVDGGSTIEVMGRRYELQQFHFHRPSEERIDGRAFDMSAHLVHKDAEGRLAVVAVLLEGGSAHPLVQAIWNNLPLEKGEEVPARGTIELNALLPAERGYFTYMGSLTTPPCSEGVLWMVMKQPVTVSPQQIAIFSRLYPMNARPVQSASGRLIKESN